MRKRKRIGFLQTHIRTLAIPVNCPAARESLYGSQATIFAQDEPISLVASRIVAVLDLCVAKVNFFRVTPMQKDCCLADPQWDNRARKQLQHDRAGNGRGCLQRITWSGTNPIVQLRAPEGPGGRDRSFRATSQSRGRSMGRPTSHSAGRQNDAPEGPGGRPKFPCNFTESRTGPLITKSRPDKRIYALIERRNSLILANVFTM